MSSPKFNFKFKVSKDVGVEKSKRILMKSMFKMEELAVQNAPSNEGELVEKITLFPQILSDNYTLVSGAKHSEAMEYGTRPFYAPIKPLKKWAAKKLGDENIAYAVQKKIAKEGITAQPFMRPALFQVEAFWVKKFAEQERNR